MPNRKMRVLIIRNAYQKDTGGAEQYSYNLALALNNSGHVPIVVTKHGAIQNKCRDSGIRTVRGVWHESQEWGKHYYIRKPLMSLWYCWLILRHRITIVNPQSRDDFVFATIAGSICRRRVFWTDHADLKYILDRANHPHPRMQTWILNAAAKTNSIICVSSSEKTSIEKVAPEIKDRLTLIHNGVFRPVGVNPVEKDKFVIGTNARLVPDKGIGELIEAYAKIHKTNPESELWLLGGTSGNENKYRQLAKGLGVESSVKLLGYVQTPNNYVASMDIFVHASYHEAFSLAIIEACMLGRPVIATRVGGTPEIINNDTGILIPPKDVNSIAAAISRLMRSKQLRTKLGKAAQSRAEQEFDFQKIVESKIVPLYERSKI